MMVKPPTKFAHSTSVYTKLEDVTMVGTDHVDYYHPCQFLFSYESKSVFLKNKENTW